eukprot:COSAG01_NODE_7595_length_3133_cov_31.926170_2_plen_74_part_00
MTGLDERGAQGWVMPDALLAALCTWATCACVWQPVLSAPSAAPLLTALSVIEELGRGRGVFRDRMRRAAYVAT